MEPIRRYPDPADAAVAVIDLYGDSAALEAALLVEAYNSVGDTEAENLWNMIIEAILDLELRSNARIH